MTSDGPKVQMIELSGIAVKPERMRPLRPELVDELAESINRQGLLQPIVVRPCKGAGYMLVAGRHRLEAVRRLGHDAIAAVVIDAVTTAKSDGSAKATGAALLAEIDENLIRGDLSPAERAGHIVERKALYEKLYPEAKRGARGGRAKAGKVLTAKMAVSFVEAEAKRTRRSERSIRRDVSEAERIGGKMLTKIAGTSLDKRSEIAALALMDEQERQRIVERAVAGEKVSAVKTLREADTRSRLRSAPGVTPEVIRARAYTRQAGEALRLAHNNKLAPANPRARIRAAKSEITKTHVEAAREVAQAWDRLATQLEQLISECRPENIAVQRKPAA
jgi:ParB/RepB/Spo0J family partition protein